MSHGNHCLWVRALLQTFPGGALKHGQELGEGLKKSPEVYQINKHFLLVSHAPSTVLAVRDTKMKMTSLTSNPCLVHPPVRGFFRSRAEFRGSTGSGPATTQEPTVGASEKQAWRHSSAEGDFSYRVSSSARK